MKNVIPLIAASCFTISACAKDPEKIAAVTMDDASYSGYSCQRLSQEETRQWQLLQALSADQKKAQSGDALGVFLLGLPISSMSGSDKETEIAVAKGRLDALDRRQVAKNCPETAVDVERRAVVVATAQSDDV